jgi:N-acetylmuramoyl-L-alanine amidase
MPIKKIRTPLFYANVAFLICALLSGCASAPKRGVSPAPGEKAAFALTKLKKIAIDAGHGGNDPGAIGRSGLREKDVNLDIAKRLNSLLRAAGVEVLMIRSSDRYIPLSDRIEIANDSAAEFFISIHSNANHSRSLNGFEVYYVSSDISDTKRAMYSARSRELVLKDACLGSDSLSLKATLWDMIYTFSRAESRELARSICQSVDDSLDLYILGIKGARYAVLAGARMPAVLVEVGFLSNYNEERLLKSSSYRQKIAEGIFEGIKDYAQNAQLLEVTKR